MAKLILSEADAGNTAALAAGLRWSVVGTNDVDTVLIEATASADLTLLGGEDVIGLYGSSLDYVVSLQGTTVSFTHSSGAVVTTAVSTVANKIVFGDGEVGDLWVDVESESVRLGSQTITDSAAPIMGAGAIDNTGQIPNWSISWPPSLSISGKDDLEGGMLQFTVSLSKSLLDSLIVDHELTTASTTTDADFGAIMLDGEPVVGMSGQLVFESGTYDKVITIDLLTDNESPELYEALILTLSDPSLDYVSIPWNRSIAYIIDMSPSSNVQQVNQDVNSQSSSIELVGQYPEFELSF